MIATQVVEETVRAVPIRLSSRDKADVRWFWGEAEAEFGMRSNFGMQVEKLQLYAPNLSEDGRELKRGGVRLALAGMGRGRQVGGGDGRPKTTHLTTWTNPWTDRRIDSAGRYHFVYDVMRELDAQQLRALWLVYGPELDEVRACLRRLTRREGPDPRGDDPVHRPHYDRLGDLTLIAEDTDEARQAALEANTTPRRVLAQRIREDVFRLRVRRAAEALVANACEAYVTVRGPERRMNESWASFRRRRNAVVR